MAHKVIVPQKKIISRSFLNSGTLIVIFHLILRSNIQHVYEEPLFLCSKFAAKHVLLENCKTVYNNKNQILFNERKNIERDKNIKLAQERDF